MPSKSTIEFFFKPKSQPAEVGKKPAEQEKKPEEGLKKPEEQDKHSSGADSPAKHEAPEARATPPTRKRLRQFDSDDDDAEKPKSEASQPDKVEKPKKAEEVSISSQVKPVEAESKKGSDRPEGTGGCSDGKFLVAIKSAKKESQADPVGSHGKASKLKSEGETFPAGRDEDAASDDEHDNGQDEDDEQVKEEILKRSSMLDTAKLSWKAGQPVPYSHLATMFEKVEKQSKRLEIISLVTDCLRSVIETTPDDLLPCVYLCVNKLAPAHEGVELGIGDMILKKALAEATGRQVKDIQSDYDKVGDLGSVAMKSRSTQRVMFAAKSLTVQTLHKSLLQIAKMTGKDSATLKKDKIKSLLVAAKGIETQFIVRHLQGKMRIGLAEQTVLVALAHSIALSVPQGANPNKQMLEKAAETLREVYSQLPCYDKIVPVLLKEPIKNLPLRCYLQPGIPVHPMLAHPTKGVSEVLDRFADQTFTCEYKYDGERGQIHMTPDGTVRIFSRNSEDNTPKYPDLIALMPKVIREETKSFILDAEVVAYDRETKKILPFQVLSTRKRKDANEDNITVQVCLFAFDMLYYNGEPLIKKSFQERRELLKSTFREVEGSFAFAKSRDASDTEEILAFLNDAVADSCEGLMVKTLLGDSSTYEPAQRSHKWLKVKKDYIDGMTDSLDLVPIGAFYGKGKRTGVYGAYLLACYNEETEDFEAICKIGTGINDTQLKEFHEAFEPHIIQEPKSYYQYDDSAGLLPNVWFEPKIVWEVAAADLSISPKHKAAIGLVDESRGIALRFPRLVRVRDDKGPEQATSSTQVAAMYRNQAVIGQ